MVDTSIEVKRVHKLDTGSTLKAFVDIVVANVVLIKGLRIVHGKNGLFVSMPRKQGKDGQW
ncbi:MAG: septation protein SpoVG family protein, partial [Candidatus Omnitrophota bacterium]